MDIKNYLKEKWAVLKPILVNGGMVLWALIKDGFIKIGSASKGAVISLLKGLWSKIKDITHSIKTKVLIKELAWVESIADWFMEKGDELMEILYGSIEDLPDGEGDSEIIEDIVEEVVDDIVAD